jgi:prevent-host-death family protein
MSNKIGVRELKNRTSQVIRSVREELAEYVVTLRGEPVAVLRPVSEEDVQRLRQMESDEALAEMKSIAQEVAAAWTSEKSGVELVSEQRR